MSVCPACNGTGVDKLKTEAMYKRERSSTGHVRCWTCNGNGNDTAADFVAFKKWQNERSIIKEDNKGR